MRNYSGNLIMSSWPSAGGTSTSLILAKILGLSYVYAGGVLKDWARAMDFDPTSNQFHEWEKMYGEHWDKVWEPYIEAKLRKESGLLYEGKTAGFLLPSELAFEVMIVATPEARVSRASTDGRTEEIIARDKFLQERWKELFGFDFLSREEIKQNYDLLVDNSHLSIRETTKTILKTLNASEELLEEAKEELDELNKEELKSELNEMGLILSSEQVMSELREMLPELFKQLPKEMQDGTKHL